MVNWQEYESTFKKGTIVEVSSEDEGLRGSWYTATVIRTLSRTTHKLLVQYHNLMADEKGSKPLREFVPAILVRPIPPRPDPNGRVFQVMEDVDAFHNDGWWEGVVTRVLRNDDGSDADGGGDLLEGSGKVVYSVFFRCSREQIEFTASDLRLHREWVRGSHWVPPLDLHAAAGQKRKNGEDGEGGRIGGEDRGARNGDRKYVGKRSGSTLTKEVGGLAKNGGGRGQTSGSNHLVSNGVVAQKKQKISSNGMPSKGGVTRNRKVKEPRRRATNHVGHRLSRK